MEYKVKVTLGKQVYEFLVCTVEAAVEISQMWLELHKCSVKITPIRKKH